MPPLSMSRGVNQLLFTYLPGRTVDWEDGLAIVQLGAVQLSSIWDDESSKRVLDEVSERIKYWSDRGGLVDPQFPDPREEPGRFVVGEPRAIDAHLLEAALICRGCSRLVFRTVQDLQKLGPKARVCPSCGRQKLRQFGQVFVHGCGELIPVSKWLPRSKMGDHGLLASSAPLQCRECGDLGEPVIPAGAQRIRDMTISCRRCKGVIAARITGRCPRCIARLPPRAEDGSDSADYERGVVPRILMRLTNYVANEAFYPQTLTILRLGRPRVVADDTDLIRELKTLLPLERRPGTLSRGQRIAALARQLDDADRTGDTDLSHRLEGELLRVSQGKPEPEPEVAGSHSQHVEEDVLRGVEESLALLTEVTTESMPTIISQAGKDAASRVAMAAELLRAVGFDEVRLVRDLPIINATYGYTRRSFEPTYRELNVDGIPTTVRPFYPLEQGAAQKLGRMDLRGRLPILAREGEHEGLFFSLSLPAVLRWLKLSEAGATRSGLLGSLEPVDRYYDSVWSLPRRRMLFGLLHTMSHVVMRSVSRLAGLERTSLGEHIFLPIPGFVVYANAGTFNLGVMEVVLRDHILTLLKDLSSSGVDCVHDPDCIEKAGACVGCVHAPEVVCRYFNHGLSRALLIGGHAPWTDLASAASIDAFWPAYAP